MNRLYFFLNISLVVFFLCGTVTMAQDQEIEDTFRFDDLEIEENQTKTEERSYLKPPVVTLSLYDIWFNRFGLLNQNNLKKAEEEFKRFNEARLDRGIKRPKLYSAALTREAFQYLWADDPISAIESFTKAVKLDPTNSEAYYGRARAYLSKYNLISWLFDTFRGSLAIFNDFWSKFFYLGNLFFTSLIGISLWVFSLIIIFFIKYEGLFNHDVGELIPLNLNKLVITIIAWTILLIPLFLGKGFFMLLLFWFILIGVYLNRTEKILASLLLVLLLAYPLLLNYGISFYTMYNNRVVHSLFSSYYGGWDPKVVQFLVRRSEEHPADMEPYFLLGMLYRKQGDFFQAKIEYERALKQAAYNAKIYNNLGNIYYFLNDNQQAIAHFQKAIQFNPDLASTHYNLSKAYLAKFEFDKADNELGEARMIDRERINQADKIYATTPNRKMIDEYIPLSELWKYFEMDGEQHQERANELWSLFVGSIPLDQIRTWAIALIVIALSTGFLREKFGSAQHCLMCGQATCKKCQRHLQSEKYCSHCMQLFIKRDGLDPSMRNEKMIQVNRYKRRISVVSRILSLLMPGAGHIYAGSPEIGSIFSFFWIFLLTRWFYSDKLFTYPLVVTNEQNILSSVVLIVVLVMIYLGANLHLSRVASYSE